jgi:hypothetical protein
MSTLDEVFAVGRFMADFPGGWWVAGGWSVDILAGAQVESTRISSLACFRLTRQLFMIIAQGGISIHHVGRSGCLCKRARC